MKISISQLMRFLVIFVVGFILSAVSLQYVSTREHRRKNRPRQCQAMRKTLAGAIEMYNLDFNTKVADIDPQDYLSENGRFVTEGYLQGPLSKHPECSYVYDPKTSSFSCSIHGEFKAY